MLRIFAGVAFLAAVVLYAVGGAGRTAFAADEPKAEKKEDKKFELPKLPEGCNPKWDFEAIQEKFTIVKGSLNEGGQIYFLLELKEDMASTPTYEVVFIDKEGVKYYKTTTLCDPNKGKKGDRVRMKLFGESPPADRKDRWVQAITVRFVAE